MQPDRRTVMRRSGDKLLFRVSARLVTLRAHLNEIREVRFRSDCAACCEVTEILDRLTDAERPRG